MKSELLPILCRADELITHKQAVYGHASVGRTRQWKGKP